MEAFAEVTGKEVSNESGVVENGSSDLPKFHIQCQNYYISICSLSLAFHNMEIDDLK